MNQKDNTNVLKKIQVGNPLINLGLMGLYDEHQAAKTDEELAAFYHNFLTCAEGSTIAESFAYSMMAFSCDTYMDSLNEALKILEHED